MYSIPGERHTGFLMSRALIVFTGERTPMLYSGTVWRLND